MANPEHLDILKQGVEAWNKLRDQAKDLRWDLSDTNLSDTNLHGINFFTTNLAGADLTRATLEGAMLVGADLTRATLEGSILAGADLMMAHLSEANLSGVNFNKAYLGATTLCGANLAGAWLPDANLANADLSDANLTGADLGRANLTGANLTNTNLSEAKLRETVFGNTNLTTVQGLKTCHHDGPSILDRLTLTLSGQLPLAFLQGCGLKDWEIEATKLYQPDLTSTQINDIVYRIYSLRADPLIQFYSCFISYASKDNTFAERLYADLQNQGVRCWFAPEDMKMGDRIQDTIDQQIRLREKLLVILSAASITSTWVEDEVEAALDEERRSPQRRTVLVPIKIDPTVEETDRAWARQIKRTRHIGDFTRWGDNDAYQKALARLLRDLNRAER
jgi:uncharacterized protein YjbI with pentapeptide repeats